MSSEKSKKVGKITVKKTKASPADKIMAKLENFEAEAKVYVEELTKAKSLGFNLTVGLIEDAIAQVQGDIAKAKAGLESLKSEALAVV